MKKIKLLIVLPFLVMLLFGAPTGAFITSAQNFTAAWVDLGSEIDFGTKKFSTIHLWFEIEINNSVDLRFRFQDLHTAGDSNEYNRATVSTTANVLKVEPTYYEFEVDGDEKYHLVFGLASKTNAVQIQIRAGTVGAPTAAQMITAFYSLGD